MLPLAAAPVTPPTVPRRPPTPLPTVEVTAVTPPATPEFLSSPKAIVRLDEMLTHAEVRRFLFTYSSRSDSDELYEYRET